MGVPIIFKGANAKMLNSGALEFKDDTLTLTTAGSPEGVETAPVGSLAMDTTNGEIFVKETGVGNTGWVEITKLTDLPVAVEDVFTPTLAQTVFALSSTPGSAAGFSLYLNGQLRLRGTDYTQSGTVLTWLDPGGLTLVTTDELIARYDDTATGFTGVTEADFSYAYDTTTQAAAMASTAQDVTFNTNGQLSGWTHTAGTADFTCTTSGKYLCSVHATAQKTAGATSIAEVFGLFNSVEIAGSQVARDISGSNILGSFGTTFVFDAVATQVFKMQFAATTTNTQLTFSGVVSSTRPSIRMSLIRIQ